MTSLKETQFISEIIGMLEGMKSQAYPQSKLMTLRDVDQKLRFLKAELKRIAQAARDVSERIEDPDVRDEKYDDELDGGFSIGN